MSRIALILFSSPPIDCGPVGSWAAISLNFTVTSNGTQYDRLGTFTLHEVESECSAIPFFFRSLIAFY